MGELNTQDGHVSKRRKLLLVGHWQVDYYEPALARGFEACGIKVVPFKDSDYLSNDMYSRCEKKLLFGPRMNRFNAELESAVAFHSPDVVVFYHPLYVYARTAARIRKRIAPVLLSFNNDNAYEDGDRFLLWRNYHGLIRHCDANFFCRESDVEHARRENVPNPCLTRFWYIEGLHRPLPDVAPEFRNDVVFAGHFERDGRDKTLEHLLNNGVSVRIFGPAWDLADADSPIRRQQVRIVQGEEYVQALAGAKIALVFLSSRNRDQYTTRCFEIPACGSMMLAPRTPALSRMFTEDREAVYYGSSEELLHKCRHYLEYEEERRRIARAGYERCMRDGHSNLHRARQMAGVAEAILCTRTRSEREQPAVLAHRSPA